MNDFFSIKLNKKSSIPVYKQLGDGLLSLIESGVIKPKSKLPPIRLMANALKINSVTVISAYKYLENKKVVYSQVGSGTYVLDDIKVIRQLPKPIKNFKSFKEEEVTYESFEAKQLINFSKTQMPLNLFPANDFKQVFNEVLDRDLGYAFNQTDIKGYEPLRFEICNYIKTFGIKTTHSKIQIISEIGQGMEIIAQALLSTGDIFFAQSPTYYGAIGSFLSYGGEVVFVDVNNNEIDILKLEVLLKIYSPKFIYVMPNFQIPTCISYSKENKQQLLQLALKYNTYIIEEDNQIEFNYLNQENQDFLPLKALDYNDNRERVIYIKSFSKTLTSGIKLAFAVFPDEILQKLKEKNCLVQHMPNEFIQRSFELYLRLGYFENHIAKLKNIFAHKYNITYACLKRHLSAYFDFEAPKGGFSFWLKLKDNSKCSAQICKELAQKGIILTPSNVFLSSENYENCKHIEKFPFIRLSFIDISNEDIEKGILIIANYFQSLNSYY